MLADYIRSFSELDYDKLPEEVRHKVKLCIADTLGVAVRGSKDPVFKSISEKIEGAFSSSGSSTEIATGMKKGMVSAAYVNSLAAHALLFDDEHNRAILHPGASIVPSMLSVAEDCNSSGKDLLLSTIIAYETSIKFAKGVSPRHYDLGFSPSGTVNSIGVASGVSSLMHLTPENTGIAMSISAQEMGGTRGYQVDGHMNYAMLLAANASLNGILSCRIAQSDLEEHPDFTVEGSIFSRAFSGSELTDYLSAEWNDWDIMDIEFKLYPGSRFCHGPVSHMLELLKEKNIDYRRIRSIEIGLDSKRLKISDIPEAGTRGEGSFSLQYNVAVASVFGRLTMDEFEEDALKDQRVKSLMKKIKLYQSEDCDVQYPDVWITHFRLMLEDGEIFEDSFDSLMKTKSTPDNVRQKFFANLGPAFTEKEAGKLWDAIMNLESLQAASELGEIISRGMQR